MILQRLRAVEVLRALGREQEHEEAETESGTAHRSGGQLQVLEELPTGRGAACAAEHRGVGVFERHWTPSGRLAMSQTSACVVMPL